MATNNHHAFTKQLYAICCVVNKYLLSTFYFPGPKYMLPYRIVKPSLKITNSTFYIKDKTKNQTNRNLLNTIKNNIFNYINCQF